MGPSTVQKRWSGGFEHSPKKLISEFNFITETPSETSVCCLKLAPSTFQKMLFKHGFWSNNFQTTLFWTPWPNTFFQILDTSVQCLNTEHCVLKRQTKRPLRFSKFTPKKEIFEKFEEFLSRLVWRETLFYLGPCSVFYNTYYAFPCVCFYPLLLARWAATLLGTAKRSWVIVLCAEAITPPLGLSRISRLAIFQWHLVVSPQIVLYFFCGAKCTREW